MFEFTYSEAVAILQVIMIDLVLAGDNAIVVGMAAATVARELRRKVIFYGILLAVVLRITFAAVTMELLGIIGLTFAGGILLLWVCWKLWRDLTGQDEEGAGADLLDEASSADAIENGAEAGAKVPEKTLTQAVVQVAIADISMSIDNIVAVAAIARENTQLLIFGLALAIAFMAFFASLIMQVMVRFRWLSYLGLAFLVYLAAMMLYDGLAELGVTASLIL